MERNRTPRRRPEAPSAPTTLTECARRYHACALALSRSFGLPMTAAFLQEYHSAISCVYIEAGRAGVRLPSGVQLPPLTEGNGLGPIGTTAVPASPALPVPAESNIGTSPSVNGDTPPLSVITTVAELPTSIPAGLQLPCAEALIVDLRPPQLSLLIGKVGLKALADQSLEPLHVALLAERARRFEGGKKPMPEANGHGA